MKRHIVCLSLLIFGFAAGVASADTATTADQPASLPSSERSKLLGNLFWITQQTAEALVHLAEERNPLHQPPLIVNTMIKERSLHNLVIACRNFGIGRRVIVSVTSTALKQARSLINASPPVNKLVWWRINLACSASPNKSYSPIPPQARETVYQFLHARSPQLPIAEVFEKLFAAVVKPEPNNPSRANAIAEAKLILEFLLRRQARLDIIGNPSLTEVFKAIDQRQTTNRFFLASMWAATSVGELQAISPLTQEEKNIPLGQVRDAQPFNGWQSIPPSKLGMPVLTNEEKDEVAVRQQLILGSLLPDLPAETVSLHQLLSTLAQDPTPRDPAKVAAFSRLALLSLASRTVETPKAQRPDLLAIAPLLEQSLAALQKGKKQITIDPRLAVIQLRGR